MGTLLLALLLTADVASPAPLPKGGRFEKGLSLELPELGSLQALGPGGAAVGVAMGFAFQFDLGAHFAIRVPLQVDLAPFGALTRSFAALAVAPAFVYRLRADPLQHWVPYLGAGTKLGSFVAGRGLLGHPLLGTTSSPLEASGSALFDDHHTSSGEPDPDLEGKLGAGLDVLAGVEWHPSLWFALNLAVSYDYLRIFGADVHTLRETVGARLTL